MEDKSRDEGVSGGGAEEKLHVQVFFPLVVSINKFSGDGASFSLILMLMGTTLLFLCWPRVISFQLFFKRLMAALLLFFYLFLRPFFNLPSSSAQVII